MWVAPGFPPLPIMALLITEECINCDVCEPQCPNDQEQLMAKYRRLTGAA